ncbi:RES family NAD+ phosphorylase [Gayadomonas joobiniege]|uniref:RES family NAD+ phosphorylase n=1 Tax=Gayadomonas joobiniege TaxID=1234606 RepID=UPI000364528E|nr:RES family NAD+ phosphorylase [Gayadomonas joobiniege]
MATKYSKITLTEQMGYRLINSKFPPIAIFDDVANADEFELLYQLQELTNPRLSDQVGNVSLLDKSEYPFGIHGCSYAVAPFTHINPAGSRFMSGERGMLYIADSIKAAIAESIYHQENYFKKVNLHYDRIVMRGLLCVFGGEMADITHLANTDPIYDPNDYTQARTFAAPLKQTVSGIQYNSVRRQGSMCWGLFTPKYVKSIKQNRHYEFIFEQNKMAQVNQLTQVDF